MKVCFTCREAKPAEAYTLTPKGRLASNCRSCKNLYDRRRYETKKETIALKCAAYYARNRAKYIAGAAAWAAANPDRRRAIANGYKHRRRSVERAGVSGTELSAWTGAQPKVCFWCDANCEETFHVDRFYPLSKGGTHTLDNLVISCPGCNLRKQAQMPEDFAAKIW